MSGPDDLARTLAAEVDGIALIIASTSGSAGAPALTAAEAIVAHLAPIVARRDADLRTRVYTMTPTSGVSMNSSGFHIRSSKRPGILATITARGPGGDEVIALLARALNVDTHEATR